jgi:phosphoribosylformylglycinamidine cyclo-ligase
MGHRLEIFTTATAAEEMVRIAGSFGIEARIVGRVEAAAEKSLVLRAGGEEIVY